MPQGTQEKPKYDVDPGGSFAESEVAETQKRRAKGNPDGDPESASAQESDTEPEQSAEATTSGEPQREDGPEQGGQPTSPDESSEQADADQPTAESDDSDPNSEGEDVEPDPEATTSDEGETPDGEGTPEEGPEDELDKPFQYNGLDEEAAEEFDGDPSEYVFISGVDDGQTAYKTVEDMVEGFERLQQHRQRLQTENGNYRERITNLKSNAEGEIEELRAQVDTFKEAYGEDVVDVLAQAEMPDEYQGMTEDDFEDPKELAKFYSAQERAEEQAQKKYEEMQDEAEKSAKQAKERQQALEDARDKAVEWVESIQENPEERFDLPQDDLDILLPEVFEQMTEVVEGEDGEKQEVSPLFRAQRLKALGHDAEAEMILDLVGSRMKLLKEEKRSEIQDKVKTQRNYRKTSPEPAEEPAKQTEEREIGDPTKSFSASQNARKKKARR